MRRVLPPPGTRGLVALAGLACAACATTPYTRSAVVTSPASKANTIASIEVERVKLRIEPLDRAVDGEAIPPLKVRIAFDVREVGYSFDPGQVVLRGPDGRQWHANGSGYQPLLPNDTVDLGFDAVVEPEVPFELVVGGLARGPKRLETVKLRLVRRHGRSLDRLFWLELLEILLEAAADT
jgi:hypothetical protein